MDQSRWHTHFWNYTLLRILVIYISFAKAALGSSNDSLSFVIVLYRHGDRSPISTYPNDPYQEDYWPQGFGQLTQIGMLQEYNLGQYLRERYVNSGFLDTSYSKKQIYVRSTDYDRTLMSAESVLAGLYPPAEKQIFKNDIKWQPIPIHTMPQGDDKVFYNFPCPRLTEIDKVSGAPNIVGEFDEKYKDKLAIFSNYTGENYTSIQNYELRRTFDALLCESRHSLAPDWATPEVIEEMRNVFAELTYYSFNTTLQRRLRGGLFIKEYIRNIQMYIDSQQEQDLVAPKFVMFSAHDSTVIKLLGTLGMFNNRTVPYSTMVMVELYKSADDPENYSLQFWLRNDSSRAYSLQMPGCDVPCPYNEFLRLTAPLIPIDQDMECVSVHLIVLGLDFTNLWTVMLFSVGIGLVVLVLLILLVVCCCSKKWRHRKVRKYGRIRAETMPEEVPMINALHNGSDLDD